MKAAFSKMPWVAIPFEQRERERALSTKYNVRTQPVARLRLQRPAGE